MTRIFSDGDKPNQFLNPDPWGECGRRVWAAFWELYILERGVDQGVPVFAPFAWDDSFADLLS